MNEKRRALLRNAARLLDNAAEIASAVMDEEQNSVDSMPENLQYSYRATDMEDNISDLDEVCDHAREASGLIENVLNR